MVDPHLLLIPCNQARDTLGEHLASTCFRAARGRHSEEVGSGANSGVQTRKAGRMFCSVLIVCCSIPAPLEEKGGLQRWCASSEHEICRLTPYMFPVGTLGIGDPLCITYQTTAAFGMLPGLDFGDGLDLT